MDNVISVRDLSKVYRLYDKPIDRLKESLNIFHKSYHKEYYALNNLSFDINRGETVGIIGINGAGKSTLLKIITGVLTPSGGTIDVKGKISALLELGAGFNMEYTGIENIYLNGTMMGFSREEVDKKLDDILSFADIGDFVYQPVKTYSSGMFVRLAFSLAVSVEPEVMIVDEALSVGDAFFQAKCFTKLEEIKARGTTILFVSHDITSVKKLCNRAIWIEKGIVKCDGDASEVCEKYLSMQIEENNRQKQTIVKEIKNDNTKQAIMSKYNAVFRKVNFSDKSQVTSSGKAEILSFSVRDAEDNEVLVVKPDGNYSFVIVARFFENVKNALFGFEMENNKGVKLMSINNFLTDTVIEEAQKDMVYEARFTIRMPKLCAGEYLLSPCIASGNQNNHVVHMRLHNYLLITMDNVGYNLSLLEVDAKTNIMEYSPDQVCFYEGESDEQGK